MPTLTVTDVKTLSRSPDGNAVTVTFSTRYVGDLDITMSVECADELISTLSGARSVLAVDPPDVLTEPAVAPEQPGAEGAPPAVESMPPEAELAQRAAEPMPPGTEPARAAPQLMQPSAVPLNGKGRKELKVTVPKTWVVTADLQVHGVVLVLFDHQTDARAGYALGADTAKQMAVGLTKNAEAVLNSKAAKRGSREEPNSALGGTS